MIWTKSQYAAAEWKIYFDSFNFLCLEIEKVWNDSARKVERRTRRNNNVEAKLETNKTVKGIWTLDREVAGQHF